MPRLSHRAPGSDFSCVTVWSAAADTLFTAVCISMAIHMAIATGRLAKLSTRPHTTKQPHTASPPGGDGVWGGSATGLHKTFFR